MSAGAPAAPAVRSLRERLLRGGIASLAGAVVARLSGLVVGVVLSRLLGKAAMGELGMVQNTVGLAGVFAGLGLGLTATKYVAELRSTDPARTGRVLGLSQLTAWAAGLLSAVALLVFAPALAAGPLAAEGLTVPLRISAALVLLGAITGAQTGALAGFEAFGAIARVNVLTGVVSIAAGVVGVLLAGLDGALWGAALGLVATFAGSHVALASTCRAHKVEVSYSTAWTEWPILWRFSAPAVLAACVSMPATWWVSTLLVGSGGYDELGVYNAASQWRNLLLFLPLVLGQLVTPVVAERRARGSAGDARATLRLTVGLALLVSVPACLVLGAAAPLLLAAYGPGFVEGAWTLRVVLATAALQAILTPVGSAIAGAGKMWTGAAMNAGWAVVLLVTAYSLQPLGALGLAVAHLVAFALHSVWALAYAAWSLREAPLPVAPQLDAP